MSDIYVGGPASLLFTVAAEDTAGSTSVRLHIRPPADSGAADLDELASPVSGEQYRVRLTAAQVLAGGLGEWLAYVEVTGDDETAWPKISKEPKVFEVTSPWARAAA
jgi:hypothetical protein